MGLTTRFLNVTGRVTSLCY